MGRLPDFEDDFDEQPVKTQAVNTQLVQDIGFGQTELYQSDEFNRISAKHKSEEAVRVAVLPIAPKMAWVHSVYAGEKKGNFICCSRRDVRQEIVGKPSTCCEVLHGDTTKAKLTVAVAVVQYLETDPKTGRYPQNTPGKTPFEIGWMRLSRSAYKSISQLVREDEKATAFDFIQKGRGANVGYDYVRVSQALRYLADPAMKAAVEEAYSPYSDGVVLRKRLGKQIDVAEFEPFRASTVEDANYE